MDLGYLKAVIPILTQWMHTIDTLDIQLKIAPNWIKHRCVSVCVCDTQKLCFSIHANCESHLDAFCAALVECTHVRNLRMAFRGTRADTVNASWQMALALGELRAHTRTHTN